MYTRLYLGTQGGTLSAATGINASGQVVGYSLIFDDVLPNHAFRTAANSPINPTTDDLGTLGGTYSFAYGINASGQVVGDSFTSGNTAIHAFLHADGLMQDLDTFIPTTPGWELSEGPES